MDPDEIGTFVRVVNKAGNACMLGSTSDGGALAIKVFEGGEKYEAWPHNEDEWKQVLEWAIGAYDHLTT